MTQKPKRRLWAWVAGALALFITGIVFAVAYQGSTKEIVAVADQFKPDASWRLKDESVVPPRIICLMGNCPNLLRSWSTGHNLTKEEFQLALQNANWNFSIDGDCVPEKGTSGTGSSFCQASGMVDGYQVKIYPLSSYEEPQIGRLILSISK